MRSTKGKKIIVKDERTGKVVRYENVTLAAANLGIEEVYLKRIISGKDKLRNRYNFTLVE